MSLRLHRRGLIGPATPLLNQATAWWTPADYVSGSDALNDKIGALDLVLGSAVGADGNDPTRTNDATYRMMQFRTDDYIARTDDTALKPGSGDFTFLIVGKWFSLSGTQIIAAKRTGGVKGWNMFANGSVLSAIIDDDVSAALTATHGTSLGTTNIVGMACRRTGSSWQTVLNQVAGTAQTIVGTNSIDNTEELRVGRGSGVTTSYANFDFYGAAWWKGTAVSDANLLLARAELLRVAIL